jgi:hypothetical protein
MLHAGTGIDWQSFRHSPHLFHDVRTGNNPARFLPGIAEANIHIIADAASAAFAHLHLSQASVLGFDTETKPVFQKGQRHQGPHLIQLATETKAFLFPVVQAVNIDVVKAALEAQHILKVGFGLVTICGI